ncbi:AAA family ATPase [candidate division KSB1 bacterium]
MEKMFFNISSTNNQKWVSFQAEQWRKEKISPAYEKDTPPPFVTISREFGCSGFSLGELLADILNTTAGDKDEFWAVYDKKVLDVVKEKYGIHQEVLHALAERTINEISDFLISIIPESLTQYIICKKLFTTIRALAHKGNSILIGRGAAVATRGLRGGLHIRIFASPEWKIDRIMKMQKITSKIEARNIMENASKEREVFVRKYLKREVSDVTNYHLMLNNEYLNKDEMIKIILKTMQLKDMIRMRDLGPEELN